MESNGNGSQLVARVRNGWYVLATSRELRTKPVARTLFGSPIVLFRGKDGRPGALLDRCPHRNIRLSLGRVLDNHIQCHYHGWEFDAAGNRMKVPGLCNRDEFKAACVDSYAAREQDGYIWVYADPGVEPKTEPYKIPLVDEKGYTTARRVVRAEGSLHAVIENALDVPHTAFLHKGYFRGVGEKTEIQAVVTRTNESVQVEYIGEPRPQGIAAKLLSPKGGEVTHYDRFIMPGIAQVEYRLGEENHILITSLCTPVEDYKTTLYAVISFRMRVPHWLVRLMLGRIGLKIFQQDAVILKEQSDAVRRFGGPHYTSTEIDLLGWQVWRLLRRGEKGLPPEDDKEWRREIRMKV